MYFWYLEMIQDKSGGESCLKGKEQLGHILAAELSGTHL
jgi:hypothetical protein